MERSEIDYVYGNTSESRKICCATDSFYLVLCSESGWSRERLFDYRFVHKKDRQRERGREGGRERRERKNDSKRGKNRRIIALVVFIREIILDYLLPAGEPTCKSTGLTLWQTNRFRLRAHTLPSTLNQFSPSSRRQRVNPSVNPSYQAWSWFVTGY